MPQEADEVSEDVNENQVGSFVTTDPNEEGCRGCVASLGEKLRNVAANVTIEPVMFLHMLGISLTGVIVQDLYIERICRVKLGYSAEACADLVINSGNKTMEEQVDTIASKYSLYRGCIEALIPIAFAMFLGSWSDKHGSKLPLLLPLGGYVLSMASYTIFSFLPDLPPHVILLSSVPVSLSGGMVAVVLSAFSFISTLTTNENRSFRISILEACWFMGAPVGLLSGSRIYRAAGFAPVFIIAAILYALGLIYGMIFIVEKKPEVPSTSSCLSDMFNVDAVKDTIRTVFVRREPPRRKWILLLILTVCCRVMTIFGPNNCMFLFTRHQFQWNEQTYSNFVTAEGVFGVIGGISMTFIGIKMLQLSDTFVGLISSIGFLGANILVAFAPGDPSAGWIMYLAAVIQMFGGMTSIMVRSILSKLVPKQELGKVFTFVACGETATPIIASALYSYIYVSTQKDFPGAFSLFTAFLNAFILLSFVYFFLGSRRNPDILRLREDEQGIIN